MLRFERDWRVAKSNYRARDRVRRNAADVRPCHVAGMIPTSLLSLIARVISGFVSAGIIASGPDIRRDIGK